MVHLGVEAAKFPSVQSGEFLEVGSAFDRGRDEDPTRVVGVGPAFDESVFDRAADEFACRVQADVELFGDVGE